MTKPTTLSGRTWIITNPDGDLFDDVDTDMIYHNAHLAITDIDKMGQFAFGNLEGWHDFAQRTKPGDMVMAGKNFGAGSSRQQAVDCFIALGVQAIIAESFGAIYKRNAINSGFPIITCPGLNQTIQRLKLPNLTICAIDMTSGRLSADGGLITNATPFSKVQMDIYHAGGLFEFGATLG